MGRDRNALDYFRMYSALKDSIFNEKNTWNIDRMKIQYETRKIDIENEILRKQNEAQKQIMHRNKIIILMTSFSLLVIVVSTLVLFRLYKEKEKANKLLTNTNLEILRQRDEIERLAITDYLTGLFNRRFFYDKMSEEFNKSKRYRHNLSCIMIDVDHFKIINDTYGHDTGDRVLKQIAATIRANCRSTDIVARYGGEEIVALLPETDSQGSYSVAEKIRNAVKNEAYRNEAGEDFSLTISIGMVTVDTDAIMKLENPENLVKYADHALYKAKSAGRDQVMVYDMDINV